jgi:signal transduction histidine kinase/CheY-like chemotaxis protein
MALASAAAASIAVGAARILPSGSPYLIGLLGAVSAAACLRWATLRGEVRRHKGIEEESKAAKQAADEANRAKGEFMAKMSHELRTPLNGVLGMTDLTLSTDLTDEQRDYLETVRSCADSLLAAVNDILDYAKIEAGKLTLSETPVNLHELMRACMRFASALAKPKGLRLGFDYEAPEDLRVYADPARLRQVLTNLLGNAVKFTREGEVRLRVRVAPAGEDRVEAELTVSDTGIGIPAEKLDAIFEPFEQADNSITRRVGGTGLGLSIVAQLVELMQGRITVASELGSGSMFRVFLPLRVCRTEDAPAHADGLPEPGEHSPAGVTLGAEGLRILLVEDSAVSRKVAGDILRKAGHLVEEVADGAAAVAAAAERTFDVVVMDVQMPVADGLEVTRAIRRAERVGTVRVPILALTAWAGGQDIAACLDAGMDDYLSKPVHHLELLDRVARLAAAARSAAQGAGRTD